MDAAMMNAPGDGTPRQYNIRDQQTLRYTGKRGLGFTEREIKSLLDVIEERLPLAIDDWETVASVHRAMFPNLNRTVGSLRRKFYKLTRADSRNCGRRFRSTVIQAHRIRAKLMRETGGEDVDGIGVDAGEAADVEDSDASVIIAANRSTRDSLESDASSRFPRQAAMPPTSTTSVQEPIPVRRARRDDEAPPSLVSPSLPSLPATPASLPSRSHRPVSTQPPSQDSEVSSLIKLYLLQAQQDRQDRQEERRRWQEEREEARQRHQEIMGALLSLVSALAPRQPTNDR
ncbi:hypothetical protein Poli38472_008215 [Pythium oligandrum]|uniref:Uncharacterized protein n=1 Tax=Pythium oligandrum TaxID=41045 RepID=A0A8K1CNM0_PYTOL|nr:hypothetical protein Poli38472_008215 [Pythium oligandrum]|eukprot:TMW65573.1 hypothetical protein Poli38472_008215 [Pythium oligandrum]